MSMTMTVRLQDDTVGTISTNCENLIGLLRTVKAKDERGCQTYVEGLIVEILEIEEESSGLVFVRSGK